jgi:hypothetical protein
MRTSRRKNMFEDRETVRRKLTAKNRSGPEGQKEKARRTE